MARNQRVVTKPTFESKVPLEPLVQPLPKPIVKPKTNLKPKLVTKPGYEGSFLVGLMATRIGVANGFKDFFGPLKLQLGCYR